MKTLKKTLLLAAVLLLAASTLQGQKPANREEVKIQTNLDCASCKKKIEDYMAFEKGVTAINADLATKVVTIEYRPKRTDQEKLIAALKKLGYDAEVVEEEKARPQE